jgi:hypothetical protein
MMLMPQLQFAKVVHELVPLYRSSSLARTCLTRCPRPTAIGLIPASVLLVA